VGMSAIPPLHGMEREQECGKVNVNGWACLLAVEAVCCEPFSRAKSL
jgi:hypothetical protein